MALNKWPGEGAPPPPMSPPPYRPSAREANVDMLVGVLGFFVFVAFCFTVWAELSGENAVTEAVILLTFCLLLLGTWRMRKRMFG
jgi:hypothetical protein